MVFGKVFSSILKAVPDRNNASTNSLQEFQAGFLQKKENGPSLTSLYSVKFTSPPIFKTFIPFGGFRIGGGGNFRLEDRNNSFLLDYMAQSVNLPSKQVTTAAVVTQGSAIKYATGVAFSQINITFQIPRSQKSRAIFERWVQLISNDADQYMDFYEDYVCPVCKIYKIERGGDSKVAAQDYVFGRGVRESGYNSLEVRQNEVTACWELRNLYPMNIGSVQLNGMDSRLMTLTVGFNFERYRFYPQGQFDWRGFLPNPDINPDAVSVKSTYSYPKQPRGDESWTDNFK
jgi:hypothetical protein